MQIKADQLAKLADDVLVDRIIQLASEALPEVVASVENLELHVRETIQMALGYGFRAERDLARYAFVGLLMGSDFGVREPAAHAVLSSLDLTPGEKSLWLQNWCSAVSVPTEKQES